MVKKVNGKIEQPRESAPRGFMAKITSIVLSTFNERNRRGVFLLELCVKLFLPQHHKV